MVARNVTLTRRTQLVPQVIAWSYFPESRSRADARDDCCCTRRQWAYCNACLVREIVEITYTLFISLNTKAVNVRAHTLVQTHFTGRIQRVDQTSRNH
jgi:5-methylcytosine-specific restriction endonuclease McrA